MTAPSERPAGRPACGARPAGALVQPSTTRGRAQLAESLVPSACRLVGAVHDGDRDDVAQLLAAVPSGQLDALLIVVAAMVDPNRTAGDLLGWTRVDELDVVPALRGLRPIEAAIPSDDPDEPPLELPGEREFARLLDAGVPALVASHIVDAALRCLRAA